MSDNNVLECENQQNNCENKCSDAVCIDAMRVYDSCGDKDCLSDLRVYFSDEIQAMVDNSASVRLKDADVLTVTTNMEPVPFNKGFYSVDLTFFFTVTLDLYTASAQTPTQVNGVAVYSKKVILFGGDGCVRVFTNESNADGDGEDALSRSLPKVTVQVAKPISLSANFASCNKVNCCLPCSMPKCVCCSLGAEPTAGGNKCVYVTLGVFSIVQIERNVQIMVHAYDFCVPQKECTNTTDNPCEVFSRLEFPKEQFFPPDICDLRSGCGCGCK